jgi:hypothetical protein
MMLLQAWPFGDHLIKSMIDLEYDLLAQTCDITISEVVYLCAEERSGSM